MTWRRRRRGSLALAVVLAALVGGASMAGMDSPGPAGPGGNDVCKSLFPLPLPSRVGVDAFLKQYDSFLDKSRRCWVQLGWKHDTSCRDASEVHGAWVINYYSPEVARWLENDRQGEIPDGGVIVKEMWSDAKSCNASAGKLNVGTSYGLAPMFKDSQGAWDGWFWASGSPGNDIAYPYSGFGLYCLNCHASAVSESTFSDPDYLKPPPPQEAQPERMPLVPLRSLHLERAVPPEEEPRLMAKEARLLQPPPDILRAFRAPGVPPANQIKRLPGEALDHVVAGPKGPAQFLTSDQCIGCHDATSSNPSPPNMILCQQGGQVVDCNKNRQTAQVLNFSPYAEAHASLMGLSGRDPVFFAQLESEGVIHAPSKADIEDTCFSCHGVMGQRQLKEDTCRKSAPSQAEECPADPCAGHTKFSLSMVYATGSDPYARYGALARDGVSCAACHHIVLNDQVPFECTFTGKFFVGPANEVYGPYGDEVKTKPMENALGLTPKFGPTPQQGGEIASSKICGSCHTVIVDVLDARPPKKAHEQTTYLEWLNSSFQDEIPPYGDTPQSCQHCHMPQTYRDTQLAFKIANIEDTTFPPMRFQLPDPDLTLPVRQPFSRHTLVGINLFTLAMFRQFPDILGIRTQDPMLCFPSCGSPQILNPLDNALASSLELARTATAKVEILSVQRQPDTLEAVVQVTNLAGHHFPSGVGFRRAFLEFRVLDASGATLWVSGGTSSAGVILGPDGRPLPSEYFLPVDGQQAYQEHWEVITRPTQVQIYEELTKDCAGKFTTSFLSLCNDVKDNRLQPPGWRHDGIYAEETGPHGEAATDCAYGVNPKCANYGKPSTGADTLTYRVPVTDLRGTPATVQATLYYQSLPPYYLADRFSLLSRCANPLSPDCYPETQRLLYMVGHLNVNLTVAGEQPIQDWKLRVAWARQGVR